MTAPAKGDVLTPTVLIAYPYYARAWFKDALNEARHGRDHHSRRREILFAVCFVESYLLEWVWVKVVKCDREQLNLYFRPGLKRGVDEKWTDIPKQLAKDGKTKGAPDLGGSHGEDWNKLINYRDGLVHARASRPGSTSFSEEEMPVPTKADLDGLDADWAVRVVVERVRRLHEAVGTRPPKWLVDP